MFDSRDSLFSEANHNNLFGLEVKRNAESNFGDGFLRRARAVGHNGARCSPLYANALYVVGKADAEGCGPDLTKLVLPKLSLKPKIDASVFLCSASFRMERILPYLWDLHVVRTASRSLSPK